MENTNTILAFVGSIIAILLIGKVFAFPIRRILKLLINSILGGVTILIINWIGAIFNFHIGLNLFTSIFVRNTRSTTELYY